MERCFSLGSRRFIRLAAATALGACAAEEKMFKNGAWGVGWPLPGPRTVGWVEQSATHQKHISSTKKMMDYALDTGFRRYDVHTIYSPDQ
jgi:hypothetical protein